MNRPKLHQTVAVFDDTQSPDDGGILGWHGVVIGIDRKQNRCSVELMKKREVVDVSLDEVVAVAVAVDSSGVIADDGESASGVYQTRSRNVATFSVRKTDRATMHFELRKPMQTDRPQFTRVHVEVPRDYELTRGSVKTLLGNILVKRVSD